MKKCFLGLVIFAGVTLSSISSCLALVYVDSFDSFNSSFWTSILPDCTGGTADIVPFTDSDGNTTNCLSLFNSASVYHKFDNAMYGRVSIRVYDNFNILPSGCGIAGLKILNTNILGLSGNCVNFGMTGACLPGYGFVIDDYAHSPDDMEIGMPWYYIPNFQEYNYIEKSYGWHTFEAVFGTNTTTLYVDNQQIYSMPLGYGFDSIYLTSDEGTYNFDEFIFNNDNSSSSSQIPVPVPEPSTFFFLGSSIIGYIFSKIISSKKYLEISKIYKHFKS